MIFEFASEAAEPREKKRRDPCSVWNITSLDRLNRQAEKSDALSGRWASAGCDSAQELRDCAMDLAAKANGDPQRRMAKDGTPGTQKCSSA